MSSIQKDWSEIRADHASDTNNISVLLTTSTTYTVYQTWKINMRLFCQSDHIKHKQFWLYVCQHYFSTLLLINQTRDPELLFNC